MGKASFFSIPNFQVELQSGFNWAEHYTSRTGATTIRRKKKNLFNCNEFLATHSIPLA